MSRRVSFPSQPFFENLESRVLLSSATSTQLSATQLIYGGSVAVGGITRSDQPLYLTASINTGTNGQLTNEVAFMDGNTLLGVAPVTNFGGSPGVPATGSTPAIPASPASHTATLTLHGLPAGNHVLSATYAGDGNFVGSSSGPAVTVATYAPKTTIDVVALYTGISNVSSEQANFVNAPTEIVNAFDQTNQVMFNSGIDATIRLVHVQPTTYNESKSMEDDLINMAYQPTFANAADLNLYPNGFDASQDIYDQTRLLKGQYGADLAVLFTGSGTKSTNGTIVGISYEQQNKAKWSKLGELVVDIGFATSDYVLAHELGHELGADHDALVNSGGDPYPYSHGFHFQLPTGLGLTHDYHDVMSYDDNLGTDGKPGTIIPFYSNPRITYLGQPIGDAVADNSRAISNTVANVANYHNTVVTGQMPSHLQLATGFSTIQEGITLPFSYSVDSTADGQMALLDNGQVVETLTPGTINQTLFATPNTRGIHTFTLAYTGDTLHPAASQSVTVNVVNHAADQAYVQAAYHTLFNRPPDAAGLATFTNLLDQGASMAQVATDLANSPEYDANLVNAVYQKYLGRSADPTGLNGWVSLMQQGATINQVATAVLASDEFYNLSGGTPNGFVNALYSKVLGRTASSSDTAAWTNLLTGDPPVSRSTVANGFVNSDENLSATVTGYYTTFLARTPSPEDLANWDSLLRGGMSQATVIGSFLASPEYLTRYNLQA